jgi:N-acyl-D-amino-acid deacylase
MTRRRRVLALFLAVALAPARAGTAHGADDAAPDLAVINARLIDGTGAPAPQALQTVLVRGGRIVAVAPSAQLAGQAARAAQILDARGNVLAPGFIDVHTHAEAITAQPRAEHFVRQGTTTLVLGNCGISKVGVGDFLREVERVRPAPNVATLVGHGTVRASVMGYANRAPRAEELVRMERLVEQAMRDGALGLSSGLIYSPGLFAKRDELVALARAAGRHGGLYATHMRSESTGVLDAIDEALEVGERGRLPVHISHFKVSGKSAGITARDTIARVEAARARGVSVTADQYVYTASSTTLEALLPNWAVAGGRPEIVRRLRTRHLRARMVKEIVASYSARGFTDLGFAHIAHHARDPGLEGLTLLDVARSWRRTPTPSFEEQVAVALDVLAQGPASMVFHTMRDEDVELILRQPWVMFASDSAIQIHGRGRPHPRGYGNSVRVLARYVREKKLIALAEAVHRMTGLSARIFGLKERGVIAVGNHADLVVLDPDRVADRATFQEPHQYAAGVAHVVVNGVVTVRDGVMTRQRGGRALRKGR